MDNKQELTHLTVDDTLDAFYRQRDRTLANTRKNIRHALVEHFGSDKKKLALRETLKQKEIKALCDFIMGPKWEDNREFFETVLYEYMLRWAFGNNYLDICKLRDVLRSQSNEEHAIFLQEVLDRLSDLFWKWVTTITFEKNSDYVTLKNGYGSTKVHKDELLGKTGE